MLKNHSQVKSLSHFQAGLFLRNYELLGNSGLGVWNWGLFENNNLTSVVSYGVPNFSQKRGFISDIGRRTGVKIFQLCRGASSEFAHPHASSYLVSVASHLIYKWKGPMIIVAYANPILGEIGTIYQACNAIYTGLTNPKGQANYLIYGQKRSGWVVRKKYKTRSLAKLRNLDPNVEVYRLMPKHRYVFLACSKLKKQQIAKLFDAYVLPYPKRHV